jgi:hypothetical protein
MRWLLTGILFLLLSSPAAAADQSCSGAQTDACGSAGAQGSADASSPARGKPRGAAAKVSAPIRSVLASMQQQALGADGERFVARYSTDLVRVNPAGEIQVYVELVEFRPEHVARLAAQGLRVQVTLPQFRLLQGWLPASAVDAVAALDFVKEVRAPDYPHRNSVGGAATEGDAILRADVARSAFGVSGAGVKVGVISDGVDFLGASQASGDLPFVEVLRAGSGNEGTAMLEIVHDLAPGAALAYWGPATSAEMVEGINTFRDVGARIVVDDLSFFGEPKFQDGMIAQTAQAFAQNGRAYVTSAGNHAQRHYRAAYARQPASFPSSDYPAVHNYNPGGEDIGNDITVPNGCSLTVILQWNNAWGASADDFDLYIVRSDFVILGAAEGAQSGTQNPIEFASWTNDTGGSVTVFIAVAEFALSSSPGSLVLDYFVRSNCSLPLQYATAEQSLVGNNAAPGIFSVAALGASSPTTAESYSSRGAHDIYFPAFESRPVPNVSAIDCVQTRTGQLGHFSNPFCGTSAAAPHVAAILALLAEASPALDSQQVRDLVMGTSLDLGGPGFDLTYGAGRVDAASAIEFSPFPPFAFIEANGGSFSAGQTIVLTVTAVNPAGNPPLDIYLGSLWPDGNTLAVLSDQGFGLGQLSAPASVRPAGTIPGGFAVANAPLLAYTFPASGIQVGTYYVFASIFRQASLADNAANNGDLVWLSYFPVFYAP